MKMDVTGIDAAKDVFYRMDLGMMSGVMLLILIIGIDDQIARDKLKEAVSPQNLLWVSPSLINLL